MREIKLQELIAQEPNMGQPNGWSQFRNSSGELTEGSQLFQANGAVKFARMIVELDADQVVPLEHLRRRHYTSREVQAIGLPTR